MDQTVTPATADIGQDRAMTAMREGIACWVRAYADLTHGLLVAGRHQVELAGKIYSGEFPAPSRPDGAKNAYEISNRWFDTMRANYQNAILGFRRVNDDVADAYFTAAHDMLEALQAAKHLDSKAADH